MKLALKDGVFWSNTSLKMILILRNIHETVHTSWVCIFNNFWICLSPYLGILGKREKIIGDRVALPQGLEGLQIPVSLAIGFWAISPAPHLSSYKMIESREPTWGECVKVKWKVLKSAA